IIQGNINHTIELGDNNRGNIIRIENAINSFEKNLNNSVEKLEEYKKNLIESKIEYEKPFEYEQTLNEKFKEQSRLSDLLLIGSAEKEVSYNDSITIERQKEVNAQIKTHKYWIDTKGSMGVRLNLENQNLRGIRLLNVDLRNANLRGADLTDSIIYADLRGADLSGAKIGNINWKGSNLNNVIIEDHKIKSIEKSFSKDLESHLNAMNNLKSNEKAKGLL
ncbi:pentapeptide repeat-containing protein, partial [Clostridium tarantellae]